MTPRTSSLLTVAIVVAFTQSVAGQALTPTQALELSRNTGRPVLAVAGECF